MVDRIVAGLDRASSRRTAVKGLAPVVAAAAGLLAGRTATVEAKSEHDCHQRCRNQPSPNRCHKRCRRRFDR